jgi:tetratricopeptide (TPR) repeat protein
VRILLRRALPFVLAVALLAAAVGSAYVAREASALDEEIRTSDTAFRADPRRADLWQVDKRSSAVEELLGSEDDVAFRKASRLFELLRERGRNPYDFDASAFRADAQLALVEAGNVGLPTEVQSRSANLDAIMTVEEAIGDPRNSPALFERALKSFHRSIQLNPDNEEAKYNLELLIRLLEPNQDRLQIRYNVNPPGRGVAGSRTIRRGHGY